MVIVVAVEMAVAMAMAVVMEEKSPCQEVVDREEASKVREGTMWQQRPWAHRVRVPLPGVRRNTSEYPSLVSYETRLSLPPRCHNQKRTGLEICKDNSDGSVGKLCKSETGPSRMDVVTETVETMEGVVVKATEVGLEDSDGGTCNKEE
jgi:hypothetical protein